MGRTGGILWFWTELAPPYIGQQPRHDITIAAIIALTAEDPQPLRVRPIVLQMGIQSPTSLFHEPIEAFRIVQRQLLFQHADLLRQPEAIC